MVVSLMLATWRCSREAQGVLGAASGSGGARVEDAVASSTVRPEMEERPRGGLNCGWPRAERDTEKGRVWVLSESTAMVLGVGSEGRQQQRSLGCSVELGTAIDWASGLFSGVGAGGDVRLCSGWEHGCRWGTRIGCPDLGVENRWW
ncbi:hypothetical protein M0R45_019161 [Rubus argutus]|uniref:Uncharacterized protein n=1 Tax=Rubus argutus TaxID=59490 RepID=A0AAW1X863_RUBAR